MNDIMLMVVSIAAVVGAAVVSVVALLVIWRND